MALGFPCCHGTSNHRVKVSTPDALSLYVSYSDGSVCGEVPLFPSQILSDPWHGGRDPPELPFGIHWDLESMQRQGMDTDGPCWLRGAVGRGGQETPTLAMARDADMGPHQADGAEAKAARGSLGRCLQVSPRETGGQTDGEGSQQQGESILEADHMAWAIGHVARR